jgi:hypothetical protein
MAYNQYSPAYGPSTPYYTSAEDTLSPDYISPNSDAALLSLTPADMASILQEQQELMRDKLAQPLTQPTTYHYHTTQAESPQRPPNPTFFIHPNSAAAELGYTLAEMAEIDAECVREQNEWLTATYGTERHD